MATFGRAKNVVRRPMRPDGNFLRRKRRQGLDQLTILEIKAGAIRPGPFRRLVLSITKKLFPPRRA